MVATVFKKNRKKTLRLLHFAKMHISCREEAVFRIPIFRLRKMIIFCCCFFLGGTENINHIKQNVELVFYGDELFFCLLLIFVLR